MKWLVFIGTREVGEVEAPDHSVARARAWARWGEAVDRVQSKVEAGIAREEAEALAREKRRRGEDDDGA